MQESHWNRAFLSRLIHRTKTITSADVVAALGAGSGAVAISLGTPVPTGGWMVQMVDRVSANFAGGSLSAVTGQIGPQADPDQVASGIALHTGTAGGAVRNGTAGINPVGPGYGGTELFMTFTPAGAELTDMTGGSLTVDFLVMVPDKNPGA